MPMSFPDMASLKDAAEVHRFRQPNEGETEIEYRRALADHVAPRDFVESHEIRTGKGWDQWNSGDAAEMMGRAQLREMDRKVGMFKG